MVMVGGLGLAGPCLGKDGRIIEAFGTKHIKSVCKE
jgi:hypothetical protein